MSIFDWSKTALSNGTADPTINWAEGQPPSSVNDSARSMMARLAHFRDWLAGAFTQGGSSNAYTITSGEGLSAYATGMRFLWKPNAASTGAVTLNIDTIGAKKVYMPAGAQAGSGDISADAFYDVVYVPSLDSANGGFKIVGSPDLTNTSLFLQKASNLSDLTNVASAQTNLGYTAADVLAKLLTVDGAGSGLDSDTLDGEQGSAFAKLGAASQNFTGKIGVGITPTGKVEVFGSGSFNGASYATYPGSVIINENSVSTLEAVAGLEFKGSSFGSGYGTKFVGFDDSTLVLGQRTNALTWTERMRVSSGGVVSFNSKTAARVNSGTAANSGLISWGTAAPGTLAEGEIYLQYDP